MHGISGTGKSTVAEEVAMKKYAVILKADAIRKHLTNTPLTKSDAAIYDKATSDLVYSFLADKAILLAKSGINVILDATFLEQSRREEVFVKLDKSQILGHVLSVISSEETAIRRIKARVGDVSDANDKILRMQMNKFVPISEKEKARVIEIPNETTPDLSLLM